MGLEFMTKEEAEAAVQEGVLLESETQLELSVHNTFADKIPIFNLFSTPDSRFDRIIYAAAKKADCQVVVQELIDSTPGTEGEPYLVSFYQLNPELFD